MRIGITYLYTISRYGYPPALEGDLDALKQEMDELKQNADERGAYLYDTFQIISFFNNISFFLFMAPAIISQITENLRHKAKNVL